MEQKTVSQYRWMVRNRAFQKAWKAGGAFGKLSSIAVTIIITILLKPPNSLTELLRVNTVIVGAIVLIIYIILYLWFFGREPVIIHNEQIQALNGLQDDKQRLLDQARPKLELSYDAGDQNSRQQWDETTVFRIKVQNVGGEQVRDIAVEIREIKPTTYGNLPLPLHFMNGARNILNPTQTVFVDIIEVHFILAGDLFFYVENSDWRYEFPLQDYEMLVSATGHNSALAQKRFRFSVRSSDEGQTQLSLTEDTGGIH